MSKKLTAVSLLSLCVFLYVASCRHRNNKNEAEQKFMVNVAIPELFQLRDDVYPIKKCIPVQLQAVEDLKKKKGVALKSAAKIEFSLKTTKPKDLAVDIYGNEDCTEKSKSLSLPASDTTPSFATVYVQSQDPGATLLTIKFGGGSWGGVMLRPFKFEK